MTKLVLLFTLLLASAAAHAAVYPISAGSSSSQIQSTIDTAAYAPGPNTVTFAAGSYNITSQITVPCPVSALTITGPSVAWPGPWTATLTGSVSGTWMWSVSACATAITFEDFNADGGEPAAGGGGILYLDPGVSNLTIQDVWWHGNQANISVNHYYDSLIWFDGADTTSPSGYDNNDTVQWSILGNTNDCDTLNTIFVYQGGPYDETGGLCAAIALHSSTNNFTVRNNIIQHQEQGMKIDEGGSTAATEFYDNNLNVLYNDISYIHRVSIESQVDANPTMNFNYNDIHDQVYPAWATWGFSLPQSGITNCENNVMIANTRTPNDPTAGPSAFEFWGSGTCSNNLVQGYWGSAMSYGFGYAPWSESYNIIQQLLNTAYIANEEGVTCCYPTMTGNVEGQVVSARVSAAPTISPKPTGTYSEPVTVTITDAGDTSGTGPQGNTSIYYTTDGSAPTTSSTLYTGPFALAPNSTVNAIGMWGAANQPKSYPAGYGFVPSAVVSAYFEGGPSAPTLVSGYLRSKGGFTTLELGTTLQFIAYGVYSDGSVKTLPDAEGDVVTWWNTTNHVVAKISSLGHVTPYGTGSINIEAMVGSLTLTSAPLEVQPVPALKK